MKSETTSYYRDGKWVENNSHKYTYDSKGRQTSHTETYREDVGEGKVETHTRKYTYSYDSKGRETKYVNQLDGKEEFRYVITYKKNVTVKYYINGKYDNKTVDTLNKAGNTIYSNAYDSSNKLTEKGTYSYDIR